MQPDPYEAVALRLAGVGLVGQLRNQDQLVVSNQRGPVWPGQGNSFWLSHKQGTWFLSTWSPIGYRIPENQDILALCCACMSAGATSAMYRVPHEIVTRFALRELGGEEYERLFPSHSDDNYST